MCCCRESSHSKQYDFGSSSAVYMVYNISVLHLPLLKTGKSHAMELFYRIYTAVDIWCDLINLCDYQNCNEMAIFRAAEGAYSFLSMVIINIGRALCHWHVNLPHNTFDWHSFSW